MSVDTVMPILPAYRTKSRKDDAALAIYNKRVISVSRVRRCYSNVKSHHRQRCDHQAQKKRSGIGWKKSV